VDGGEDIGIGIDVIKSCHQGGEEIFPGQNRGPQILPVGDQKPQQCAEKKGRSQKQHIPPERGPVSE
jgi:hypothetical protein